MSMTPYAAAKIVNARLAEEGIEKEIPPQMMYNYTKKNMIANEIVEGKKRITQAGLNEWLLGYVNKLLGKSVTVEETDKNIDENQLELDFDENE